MTSPDFNMLTAMQTIAKQQDEIEALRQQIDEYKVRVLDLNERLLEANQDINDLTWRLERLRP
jgi:molecular chaperone GrpE (heat shock protein)